MANNTTTVNYDKNRKGEEWNKNELNEVCEVYKQI